MIRNAENQGLLESSKVTPLKYLWLKTKATLRLVQKWQEEFKEVTYEHPKPKNVTCA